MAKQTKWTIYCHIHRESGRRYVGLTKATWRQRWNRHVYSANRGKGAPRFSHFANAIRKYGKDAFDHEVLEVCHTLEEANEREQHWIWTYDTRNPLRGFNLAPGGTHVPHPVRTDYLKDPGFKEKASARSKKVWKDPQKRANILSATQEAIRKPEVRRKLSDGVRKAWEDPDVRAKFEEAARERSRDPAFRQKLRDRWDDPDFRNRCSAGPAAANARRAAKSFCVNGHERVPENLASNECRICIAERRRSRRTHCPEGHAYSDGNVRMSSDGRRVCLTCLEASVGPRPCSKCGRPKSRRSGGRLRCGPCTDARTAAWRRRREAA